MEDKKKLMAAISAVMSYIKTEEEILMCSAPGMGQAPVAEPKLPPTAPMSLWAVSGRQAQMQMRNMMQMKTFR